MRLPARGFGVATAIGPDIVQAVAQEAEALGYRSFWVTDNPQDNGLEALRRAADVTSSIRLGVGVLPLSSRSTSQIAAEIGRLALPPERLILGIGSGSLRAGALDRVRAGVAELRDALGQEIVISALGPAMSRLAGEVADGVLYNWLTPDFAGISSDWTRQAAGDALRPTPRLYAYVRTCIGPAGRERLIREGARYGASPAYAAHFQRMHVSPAETGIAAPTAADVRPLLSVWDEILDELIVRAITANDTLEEHLELVRAAAPEG